MRIFLYITSLFFLVCSCDKEYDIGHVPYQPKVVVEGSIENGGYASVLLSVSASMLGPKDTLSLLNNVIKNAKVTVSDGMQSEILYLQSNKAIIPPYEYAGTRIRGEAGKNYYLTVEYGDEVITAETYIPEPVPLEDIWFKKDMEKDTIGYIHVSFVNSTKDYYQISTRVFGEDKIFYPCLYGNIDKSVYPENELIEMQINRGPQLFLRTSYDTYFRTKDLVWVKIRTQPKAAYKFWTSFQNEVLNTQNPIFPANTSLESNINGGIGLWSGYGCYTYFVVLEYIQR